MRLIKAFITWFIVILWATVVLFGGLFAIGSTYGGWIRLVAGMVSTLVFIGLLEFIDWRSRWLLMR